MKHLTVRQVQELATAVEARQQGAGTLVTFLAYSGLRWGEAVALRRSDFDLLRRQVHVRRAATEISGKLSWGPPKTHRHRTIILARSVIDLVASHLDHEGDRDDLVFTAPAGGPLRFSNSRKKVWLPALTELMHVHPEVEGLRIHDLRHAAASLAISCGGNIKAVQQMLGHEHASMILDRYGHLYVEDLEQLADRMDEKFRGAA
jgi:integrase